MKRNVNLDLMRVVAVLMVIFGHLPDAPRDLPKAIVWVADFFRHYGGLGVDLFFVLSGFLVSGLLFREYFTRGRADVKRFLIRRGFKIYPAFYVFVVVTVLLRLKGGDTLTGRDIVSELLFIQNYGPHVWSHTWSLAVEEHFYLLLAAIVAALCYWVPRNPLSSIPKFFWLTTALVFAARAWTIAHAPYATTTHRFPTHLQIDSLFTGVVLAYYFYTRDQMAAFVRRQSLPLALGGLALVVLAQIIPDPATKYLAGHLMTNAGFAALVIVGVVATPAFGAFGRAAAQVGAQSYSIYLWHAAVLGIGGVAVERFAGRPLSFLETAAWYVPLSFICGVIAAKAVELPVLRLRDRLFPDGRREISLADVKNVKTASIA
jgi:peptidoglycan/LPS O-acetylase OafA/YrhL